MKKINYKTLIITCITTLLPIALGITFYNKLPNEIAIHFDISNNPNGYFSKTAFIFGIPILMTIFQIICCTANDITDKHPEANKKITSITKWIIPTLTIIMYIVTIIYNLGNKLDIRKICMIILGIIFIILGNYLPKTKGEINGIKKLSENQYKKVARISGYSLIIDGLLCLISTLFNQYISIAIISLIILETLAICLYSLTKKEEE